MTRFAWAAWGLLVVVLDLPLLGWDVVPDAVGHVWVVIGLAGGAAVHPAFVRARVAAMAGVPVSLVTGTPLLAQAQGVVLAALVAEIVIGAVLVHQLCTGLLARVPDDDADTPRWARGLRVAAPVVAAVMLVGLAAYSTPVGSAYPVGFLASVVVGILTVVLLHRVNRAGWIAAGTQSAPA